MIRIVNLRNYKPISGEILIKVDRSSPVGNPFIMHNETERDEVCDKYDEHFDEMMQDTNFGTYIGFILTKAESHNIALGCWCYPKRCHAETIKRFVEMVNTN